MKEAENLVLKEVKDYYETKIKWADSRLTTNYELKDQKQPIFIRKPKSRKINGKGMRTRITEDLGDFKGG